MSILSEKPISYWIDSTPETNFPSLKQDLSVDVAIVGGGIVGLTAATLLKRAGKKVAVIEAKTIVIGTSGHTTAKVTSLHQLIYADLIKQFGEETARMYGESNQAAVEQVAKFIEEEQIDCDFKRRSAYTFALDKQHLRDIESEANAAINLGLPASFVRETTLPFPIQGAVKFDNQVQFHVRKYLLHLAKTIAGNGSYIFENTRVETVKEEDTCKVITKTGTVTAKDVIVATHLPILDEGLFFAKTYPKRSYIIAAPIDPESAPEGMFIGVGEDYHSIRTTPYGDEVLLLIGGGGHKVGEDINTIERYKELENYGRSAFGIDQFKYRWSTQDLVSFDKLPYIGKLTPLHNHTYVATGFSLWGMSNGTLSAMILSDLILGKENPWAHLYDATRATPFVTPESLKQNTEVGLHWLGDRLKGDKTSPSDLAVGEGKLLNLDGEKVAAYKDEQGKTHVVSAICTHLGCVVNWNNAEKSWDCPCHGSRFSCDGEILEGPAVEGLAPKADKVKVR